MPSAKRCREIGRWPFAATNCGPTDTRYSASANLVIPTSGKSTRSGLEIRTSRTPSGPATSRMRASLAILQHSAARRRLTMSTTSTRLVRGPMTQTSTSKRSATPPPMAVAASPHLRGMDGLRALAVVLVVLFHVLPGALPGGGLGVDIFFVLSGFLITGLLLSERAPSGHIRLRAFWARRARRLLPALVILLLVCTSAALAIGGDVL